MVKNVLKVFVEPGEVFDSVRAHARFMAPLLLAVIGSSFVWVWYYSSVDIAWLQDQMLADMSGNDAASEDAARAFMSRSAMAAIAVVASIVGILLLTAITAVYFMIAGRVMQAREPFVKWFAFAVWASVPGLLLLPVMAMQILSGDAVRSTPEQLNLLSFNELLFHLPEGHRWKSLLDGMGITTIWSVVLMFVGLRRWSSAKVPTAIAAVAIPHLLVFGLWAAAIALRSAAPGSTA